MSLADYHERAALAASQVISGFDLDLFRTALNETAVGIAIGRQASDSNEGKALADLATRLVARLYPLLELRVETSRQAESLAALARAINPKIEITTNASVGISIGTGSPRFDTTYFAGSNGWDAFVSSQESVQTGSSPNPFGAGVAACLAAANLFNRVLIPDWEERITNELLFSAFRRDRQQTSEDITNSGWQLDEDAVLVGAGAIGNGALWALSRSPLTGALHIIDSEVLELSNLQRYVLGVRSDEGRPKVELTGACLNGSLKPLPHQMKWAEFVQASGYKWPYVLVALDTASDRRSVQASLPNWIANSWTQPGDLGLSVHGRFDGEGACLSCLYLADRKVQNEDEIVAEALGVPALVGEIRTLLHTGKGVSRQLLEAVAVGLRLPVNDVVVYEGRPVRDLYVEGVCGGGLISLGSIGTPRQELHVPIAHQSALAGILLAASLARRSISNEQQGTEITRFNILGPVSNYLTQPALKAGNGLCICEDIDYLTAFRAKYPIASPSAHVR
jgi:Prokaryotic E2 family C/ThiF family